jgi:hypothetical protein
MKFFKYFFAETKPYGPNLKIIFNSAEIFNFKTFPHMLSQQ